MSDNQEQKWHRWLISYHFSNGDGATFVTTRNKYISMESVLDFVKSAYKDGPATPIAVSYLGCMSEEEFHRI